MTVVGAVVMTLIVISTSAPAMAQDAAVTPAPAIDAGSEDIATTGIDDTLADQGRADLVPQVLSESGVTAAAPAQGGLSEIESAEIGQIDADSQPATSETTQLVTSSTEVRRAVAGLIAVAVLTALLTALYWFKTGQQARERHARQYGGRHRADLHGPVVPDQRGPWANDALHWPDEPVPVSAGIYPDGPGDAPVAVRRAPARSAPPRQAPRPPAADRPWGSGKPTWPAAPTQGQSHT